MGDLAHLIHELLHRHRGVGGVEGTDKGSSPSDLPQLESFKPGDPQFPVLRGPVAAQVFLVVVFHVEGVPEEASAGSCDVLLINLGNIAVLEIDPAWLLAEFRVLHERHVIEEGGPLLELGVADHAGPGLDHRLTAGADLLESGLRDFSDVGFHRPADPPGGHQLGQLDVVFQLSLFLHALLQVPNRPLKPDEVGLVLDRRDVG